MKDLNILKILAPLIATALSTIAYSYLTTVVSLNLKEIGCTETVIGIVSASYYVGIVLGSFKSAYLINRIGYVKAYTIFSVILGIISLIFPVFPNAIIWCILRVMMGICVAGVWIVTESWILGQSNMNNRGKYLSIYLFILYGAASVSQLFLRVSSLSYDYIIISFFSFISIISFLFAGTTVPKNEKPQLVNLKSFLKMNPSGIYGCFFAGVTLATLYSLFPIYFREAQFSREEIGSLMFFSIFGGMVLQFPIGYISDNYSRKKLLFYLTLLSMLLSFLLLIVRVDIVIYSWLVFFMGGIYCVIYPVCMSYVCDSISTDKIVSVTQGLVMIYGIGNILGPLIAPIFSYFFGLSGLFIFYITVSGMFLSLLIYTMVIKHRKTQNLI